MKEDVGEVPKQPPKKRYQLERSLDLHLAVWANDPDLPERERERIEAERRRRNELRKTGTRRVGLLLDPEGVSPRQFRHLMELLEGTRPTEIHHPWAARAVNTACKRVGVPVIVHKDVRDASVPLRAVVLASDRVLAAPRAMAYTPAWEGVKYAKHRGLPVTVVLSDGTIQGES